MRTLRHAILLSLVLTGCGAEALAPGAIIILTNTWNEEGNENHRFNIQDDTGFEARESGTFTGTETLPDNTQYELSGSWSNSRVTMTIQRNPVQTWRANITEDNANRLVFTRSGGGTLVLVRPGQGQ